MNKRFKVQQIIAHSNGADNIYKARDVDFEYTSGVRNVTKEAESYWLLGIIQSVYKKVILKEPFCTIDLKQKKDESWSFKITDGGKDGNDPVVLYRQNIPFSDFPLEEFRMFLINGLLLLPSEY